MISVNLSTLILFHCVNIHLCCHGRVKCSCSPQINYISWIQREYNVIPTGYNPAGGERLGLWTWGVACQIWQMERGTFIWSPWFPPYPKHNIKSIYMLRSWSGRVWKCRIHIIFPKYNFCKADRSDLDNHGSEDIAFWPSPTLWAGMHCHLTSFCSVRIPNTT